MFLPDNRTRLKETGRTLRHDQQTNAIFLQRFIQTGHNVIWVPIDISVSKSKHYLYSINSVCLPSSPPKKPNQSIDVWEGRRVGQSAFRSIKSPYRSWVVNRWYSTHTYIHQENRATWGQAACSRSSQTTWLVLVLVFKCKTVQEIPDSSFQLMCRQSTMQHLLTLNTWVHVYHSATENTTR